MWVCVPESGWGGGGEESCHIEPLRLSVQEPIVSAAIVTPTWGAQGNPQFIFCFFLFVCLCFFPVHFLARFIRFILQESGQVTVSTIKQ